MPTLLTLPNELLLGTASFLPHSSVFTLLLTNRRLQQLLEGELYKNPTPQHISRIMCKVGYCRHNTSTLQRFLDNGLDIRIDLGSVLKPPIKAPVSLLAWAIACGSLEITRLLLETGKVDIEEYEVRKRNIPEPCGDGYSMMELLEEFGVPMVADIRRKLPQPNSLWILVNGGMLIYMPKK
jgi:hypothetical protein